MWRLEMIFFILYGWAAPNFHWLTRVKHKLLLLKPDSGALQDLRRGVKDSLSDQHSPTRGSRAGNPVPALDMLNCKVW